jgi:predicted nucleotidyltransferase
VPGKILTKRSQTRKQKKGLTKKQNRGILTRNFEKIEEVMRLTEGEVSAIKESVHLFDPDAKIYLFGSRADDMKKGGDIDLIIISKRITSSRKAPPLTIDN